MNAGLLTLEYAVLVLALGFLLVDLWMPHQHRRSLGYVGAILLTGVLLYSFTLDVSLPQHAFQQSYVMDGLALFFKRFFLLAAVLVLLLAVEFSDRIESGLVEYYSLILFALLGMMFAASANNFPILFVSLELITVTFYVLTSFLRSRYSSLEAGVKYLILGAFSSAFLVFGVALIYGTSGTMEFDILQQKSPDLAHNGVFLGGLLLVLSGLAFKLAAFPFQVWAPDVYQGSPVPSTAFLAIGSKAAGIALVLRVLFVAVPGVVQSWSVVLMIVSGITILYGNLCAIPQQNLKRLFGYSSIAHAGYVLLGIAALNQSGSAAVLYYLGGYLFTVMAAFFVVCLVLKQVDAEEISGLAGLNQRSPFLAASLTLAMVSLAGIPPLAGFFGKFLLLKSVVEKGGAQPAYYVLAVAALVGVVISLYYYLGVVRAIYWSRNPADLTPIPVSIPSRIALGICALGMIFIGVYPAPLLKAAESAVQILKF